MEQDKILAIFQENKTAAKKEGIIAGDAMKNLEIASGEKINSKENYLIEHENKKRLKSR